MDSKVIAGIVHVWSILENGWVTEAYWDYVNGVSSVDPAVRSYA